jgi:GT2 family glycosyltransferase
MTNSNDHVDDLAGDVESASGGLPSVPAGLVSFVVIAYNEQLVIEATLGSIRAQRTDHPIEIVVVDDGSTDATVEIVTRISSIEPRLRLLSLGRNLGRGYGRRAGVGAARGDMIATVDADIVLPEDWLIRCLEAIPGLDAVAGTAFPDGDAVFSQRFGLTPKPVGHSVEVTGSNALYRSEVFEAVRFDARMREGEDVVLNHDLAAAGKQTRTIPGLFVHHAERKTFAATLRWMFQSGRGASRQLRTYRTVRLPDLTYFGFVGCLSYAVVRAVSNRPPRAWSPLLYLGAAATGHTARAYEWTPRRSGSFAVAILADIALMGAYFTGRIAGPPTPEATPTGQSPSAEMESARGSSS